MADDGGVWVKATPGVSTTGGGIYAKVADDGGKWVEIGANESGEPGLPGVGGWATITAVSGTYTKHSYGDWVAYEWTGDGSVTMTVGLLDTLVVGGGGWGNPTEGNGSAGYLSSGVVHFSGGTTTITVPTWPAIVGGTNTPTGFGSVWMNRGDNIGNCGATGHPTPPDGFHSSITGVDVEYAQGGSKEATTPGSARSRTGVGGSPTGAVIVRVPAAYAEGVVETFHGWDSFALVNDGVVTEVTKVPDNEPHTLDAEWLPCDAEVQAGWNHADGEFTPPPAPTRDDLIAELKERIKDLQKDK